MGEWGEWGRSVRMGEWGRDVRMGEWGEWGRSGRMGEWGEWGRAFLRAQTSNGTVRSFAYLHSVLITVNSCIHLFNGNLAKLVKIFLIQNRITNKKIPSVLR